MGYRSEICCKIHVGEKFQFDALLEKHGLLDYFEITEPPRSEEETHPHPYYKYHTLGLKWYNSYPDVQEINQFFRDSKYSLLIRLGEDGGDIETIGNIDPDELSVYAYTTNVIDW